MEPIRINIKQAKSYNIFFEEDFKHLPEIIKEVCPLTKNVLIVTDKNVEPLYLNKLKETLSENELYEYVVEAGEASKNEENALKICKCLMENNFNRSDLIIALGGGVVGDLTAFAASLYKRGICLIAIPTTLLSMTDSSIGGKTAVDVEGYKNMIGTFYNPDCVYINISALNTLPEREYYAGFAEIMKMALLADDKFYVWLIDQMYEICDKDTETVIEMLSNAINIKKMIVEKDPFETTGDRALLNLGHTIGHGIEKAMNPEYLHGECVALGCVAAAYISRKMNMIKMEDYYEIRDMFVPFNLPISIVVDDITPIIEAMMKDKKNTGDGINMVLLKKIGKAVLVKDVSLDLIKESINEINFDEEE